MLEVTSLVYMPFDTAEIRAIRVAALVDRRFNTLIARTVRVQFLRAAMESMLEEADRDGLALLEDALLLLLGASPASNAD